MTSRVPVQTRVVAGGLVLSCVLALAGCAKQNTRETAAAGESGTQTVGIDLVNDAFRPSAIEAMAGQPLVLELSNEGWSRHTFTLPDSEADVDVVLDAGASETITVDLPEGQGEVRFICRFHHAGGMRGQISYR